jgi:uncharacterized DUF497 family protein
LSRGLCREQPTVLRRAGFFSQGFGQIFTRDSVPLGQIFHEALRLLKNTTKKHYTKNMKLSGIEWDEIKNAINKVNHSGLSFEAAQYVFTDPQRIERRDESDGNTSGEERRQTLGMVEKVLMVVYTETGETKKIISARLAGKAERRSYHGYYQIDGKGWEKNS